MRTFFLLMIGFTICSCGNHVGGGEITNPPFLRRVPDKIHFADSSPNLDDFTDGVDRVHSADMSSALDMAEVAVELVDMAETPADPIEDMGSGSGSADMDCDKHCDKNNHGHHHKGHHHCN